MMKKWACFIVVVLLISSPVSALAYGYVEIFDVSKEAVIRKVESKPAIQKEVTKYLEGIHSMYGGLNPVPTSGFMVKVPLEHSVQIPPQWVDERVDEVIVVLPPQGKPYLLVVDDRGRLFAFYFKGDTRVLLKQLHFQPASPPEGARAV